MKVRQSGGVVLDGDVLQGNLAALDLQRKGAESSDLLGIALSSQRGDVSLDIGMVIPRDDGLVAVLATDLDIGQPLWHHQFLFISTFLNIDHLMILHEGAAHLDGICNVTELAGSVASHKQGVGIVITLGLRAHDSHEGTNDAD